MGRIACLFLFFILSSALWAGEEYAVCDSIIVDTCKVVASKPPLWKRPYYTLLNGIEHLFVETDSLYIEHDPYKFQALLLNNNSYEIYQLNDNEGNHIRFSPEMLMKVGPYAGFSLLFFGWSVDVAHLKDKQKRSESTFRIYSLPGGIEIFNKKSGEHFRISDLKMDGIDTSPIIGKKFDGITSSITGFNTYYIFNNNRFSYPAAFNQSTVQRRSAGSALAGIGYTHHTLKIDWQKLNSLAVSTLGMDFSDKFDQEALFEKVIYTDFSLSGGYAYNYVFKKNWLLASSMSLSLAYTHSSGKVDMGTFMLKDFSFGKFNIDGLWRFGIVYNNHKWFAGANVIAHSYNYKTTKFYTNNSFGSLNLYVGFNFWHK